MKRSMAFLMALFLASHLSTLAMRQITTGRDPVIVTAHTSGTIQARTAGKCFSHVLIPGPLLGAHLGRFMNQPSMVAMARPERRTDRMPAIFMPPLDSVPGDLLHPPA